MLENQLELIENGVFNCGAKSMKLKKSYVIIKEIELLIQKLYVAYRSNILFDNYHIIGWKCH